jgi:predicted Fe-S protein YdhL (DUF1289 family)
LGFSAEELDQKTPKAIERAEKNLNYKLTDELCLKLTQEYVNWRFILAKMNDNDEVEVFQKLMETYVKRELEEEEEMSKGREQEESRVRTEGEIMKGNR